MFFGKIKFVLFVLFFLTVIECFGQTPPVTRNPRTNPDPNRQDAATQRWYEELRRRENSPTGIGSVQEKTETLIAKLRSIALKKLKPTAEEENLFADFLKQSGTGLLRFAAETDCTKILDIANPNIDCLNYYVEGKARAYSFRKQRYSHEAYADLERLNGNFVLPGTYILGLLTILENTPIENVSLQNENVAALKDFAPAVEISRIIAQNKEIGKGLLLGNSVYRNSLPIQENTTYLLRSVAYNAKFKNLPKTEKQKGSLDDDERSDVIVVFKVVRKDFDDTILLLWKEIYRKDAPKIEVDMGRS